MQPEIDLDLSIFFEQKAKLIEQKLQELIPSNPLPYQSLFDAARYSLLSGGKRLRPILVLATTQVLQGSEEVALLPACALELIHTYSLIHDDLPCMDNDDFRRGRLTLHKVYNEGHAVLTGDYLLTFAFEVLARAEGLSAEQKIALIQVLASYAGGDGMIAGQVLDVESFGKKLELEQIHLIHQKKTAALITAAVEFGAIIANVPQHDRECLRQFGQEIGLAFQIIDDVLDVTSSQAKHGKKVGSDVANDKLTYVSLVGIESSQKIAYQLFETAIERLKTIPYQTALLSLLAKTFVFRQM